MPLVGDSRPVSSEYTRPGPYPLVHPTFTDSDCIELTHYVSTRTSPLQHQPRLPFPPRIIDRIHPPPTPLPSEIYSTDSSTSSYIHISDHEQLVHDLNHVGPGYNSRVRPHICNFSDCNKAFARRSDLQRHFMIHSNLRLVNSFAICG